jgi:hypothetical protein
MDGGRGIVGGVGVDVRELLSSTDGDASRLGHLYTISLLLSSSSTLAQLIVESGDLLLTSHERVVSVLSHLCRTLWVHRLRMNYSGRPNEQEVWWRQPVVMAGRIFTMWREVREVSGREMHGSRRQSKLYILSPSIHFTYPFYIIG